MSSRSPNALVRPRGLDHEGAQARARWDLDLLEVQLAGLLRLGSHLLVATQAGAALGLPGLRVGAHPLQLIGQPLAQLRVLGPLHLQAGRLRVQVGRVVALVRVGPPAIELEDPLGHVLQEVAVVGDRDDGPRVLLQVLLEPLDALGIEVVGRLVEEQEVGLLEQQLAQRHATPLAARQDRHVGVRRGAVQGVHRLLELGVEIPRAEVVDLLLEDAHLGHERIEVRLRIGHQLGDLVVPVEQRLGLGHAVLDVAQDVLGLVELRLLGEDADRVARAEHRVAVRRLVQAGHDLDQARLARAVGPDDADLGAGQEGQGDVVEDDLLAEGLASLAQCVDELSHGPKGIGRTAMPRTLEAADPRRRPTPRTTGPRPTG